VNATKLDDPDNATDNGAEHVLIRLNLAQRSSSGDLPGRIGERACDRTHRACEKPFAKERSRGTYKHADECTGYNKVAPMSPTPEGRQSQSEGRLCQAAPRP
jgi:hypothetical protein